MRNMNLTPRSRDLTMLLNSDRQTETPFYRNTEKPNTGIPENRQNEKPESGEDWVKTSVSLRASTPQAQDLGRRARHAHPGSGRCRPRNVPGLEISCEPMNKENE